MTSLELRRIGLGFLVVGLMLSPWGAVAAAEPLTEGAALQGGWSAVENVSSSPDEDSEDPALAITPNGAVHVVWEEGDELYHSHRSDSTWSEPERIAGSGDGEQPALAAGLDDAVHLVYVNGGDVFYVGWDSASWDIPQNISQTTLISDSPDVAVGSDESLHVVASETAGKQLYYGTSEDGSSWSYGPIQHDLGFAYGEGASLDVFGTNVVRLAYKDDGDQEIYSMTRSAGSWSPPENVSDSLDANSTAPALALDGDGRAHVVWQETIDGTPQIQYASGADWTPVVTLSDSADGAHLPALTTAGERELHVVWYDEGFPYAIRHVWRPSPTSDWGVPSTAYTSTSSLNDVALASGPDGLIHAAWVEGTTGEILYARNAPYRVFLPLILRSRRSDL